MWSRRPGNRPPRAIACTRPDDSLHKEGMACTSCVVVLLCLSIVHALPQPLFLDLMKRIPSDPTSSSEFHHSSFNLMLFVVSSDANCLCTNHAQS